MSEMKMRIALSQLKPLVEGNHLGVLETIITEHGLDFITSNEFLDFCRRRKAHRIVVFVATLASHNVPETDRPVLIEQCYTSIIQKDLRLTQERRFPSHVLNSVVRCIIEDKDIAKDRAKFNALMGSDNDWLLAYELALDHGQENNAYKIINKKLGKEENPEFLLNCAKSIIERAIDVTGGEDIGWENWIQCQKRIHEELCKLNFAEVASKLAMLIAQYHSYIEEHDQTIEWYGRASEDQIIAKYQIAEAYAKKGNFDKTFILLDEFLGKLCEQKTEWIDGNFQNADATGEKHKGQEFNSGAATKALTDLQETLAKAHTKAFLVSGTLLGYARQRSFLSHDKDIDVGIFEDDNIFDVINTLMSSQKFSIKQGYFNIDRIFQMPVVHLDTGFAIDVFVYHPDGDGLITGVQSNFGYTQNFRFSKFDLQEIEFVDAHFYAPSDIDKNLTENFGDWQTPDPNFISHLQCPTTVDVGGQVYMLVCRLEMVRSIVEGKPVKVDRITQILRNHASVQHAMQGNLVNKLEARFSSQAKAAGVH